MNMEQNTPTNTPGTAPVGGGGEKNTMMLIGGGVAVIVLVLIAWLMMGQNNATPAPGGVVQSPVSLTDPAAASLSIQSTSDEITAIDADLKATDLNSLNDINAM